MSESIQPHESLEDPPSTESIRRYLQAGGGGVRDERDAEAIDIAGIYLKKAALAFAKERLSNPAIQIDDDKIAQVETLLRAARHMRRTSHHNGDPIPSIQRPDGSRIPLIAHLIDVMGREEVILSEESDDPNSRSKANRDIRKAREKIIEVAQQVIREGEIVA